RTPRHTLASSLPTHKPRCPTGFLCVSYLPRCRPPPTTPCSRRWHTAPHGPNDVPTPDAPSAPPAPCAEPLASRNCPDLLLNAIRSHAASTHPESLPDIRTLPPTGYR